MQQTRKQRRAVNVASEALTMVNEGNVRISPGAFVQITNKELRDTLADNEGEQLQQYITQFYGKCRVCMLGACFLAHVRRLNDLTITSEVYKGSADGKYYVNAMSKVFGKKRLQMMEVAFEEGQGAYQRTNPDLILTNLEYESALNFCRGEDPTVRVQLILENVIDNGGTFRPPHVETQDPFLPVGQHAQDEQGNDWNDDDEDDDGNQRFCENCGCEVDDDQDVCDDCADEDD